MPDRPDRPDLADSTRPDLDLVAEATVLDRPGDLVPLPRALPAGANSPDHRRSDVDPWGRSERLRELTRRVYDPIYKHYFRVEWEHFDRLPEHGGALIVANHAGAIPPDAPAIMHGIEKELGRRVYGLAENLFRTVPVVGTLWARGEVEWLGASRQRVSPVARRTPACPGFSRRRTKGSWEAIHRALPVALASVVAGSWRSRCGPACR